VVGSAVGARLIPRRKERMLAMGHAWRGVLLNPGKWWRGYAGRPSNH
jgi:hypothetical protein